MMTGVRVLGWALGVAALATVSGCGPSFPNPLDLALGVTKFEVKVVGDKPGTAFKINLKADDVGREVSGTVPATFEMTAKSSVIVSVDRGVPEDESKLRVELYRTGLLDASDERSGAYSSLAVSKVKIGDTWR